MVISEGCRYIFSKTTTCKNGCVPYQFCEIVKTVRTPMSIIWDTESGETNDILFTICDPPSLLFVNEECQDL